MASLRIREKHFCCGFLVSMRIVMTTGFCANYMKLRSEPDYTNVTVFLGNTNLSETEWSIIINVKHAKHHPNYNPDKTEMTGDYDIGYVLLAGQLCRSPYLSVTKFLMRKPNFGPGMRANIYGWGSVKLEDKEKDLLDVPMSTMLREITMQTTTQGPCERILKRKLTKNQICGIGTYNGVSAGQGDAGSPVVRGHQYIGITSIVNIVGTRNPFVFIGAKLLQPYIKGLKQEFPEVDECILRKRIRDVSSEMQDVCENSSECTHRNE